MPLRKSGNMERPNSKYIWINVAVVLRVANSLGSPGFDPRISFSSRHLFLAGNSSDSATFTGFNGTIMPQYNCKTGNSTLANDMLKSPMLYRVPNCRMFWSFSWEFTLTQVCKWRCWNPCDVLTCETFASSRSGHSHWVIHDSMASERAVSEIRKKAQRNNKN